MDTFDPSLPKSITRLIEEFMKLPGVGRKTAQRFVFFLLKKDLSFQEEFGNALTTLTKDIRLCRECFHFAEGDLCEICRNPKRDEHIICTVEDSLDLLSIEKSNAFRGKYHILGGIISPIDGIGPDKIRIKELKGRIERSKGKIEEVIIATNPTLEGEATATYIWRSLEKLPVKITRIARGLPVGGDVEFTDEVTLARALENRSNI